MSPRFSTMFYAAGSGACVILAYELDRIAFVGVAVYFALMTFASMFERADQ